jgi:translocation and assembly module TamB
VRADVSIGGPATSLAAQGTIDASGLQLDTTRLAGLHADIALTKVTAGTPEGRVDVSLRELHSGIEIRSAQIGIGLATRDGATAAEISVDGQMQGGYDQRLRAHILAGEERIAVDLREVSLEIPSGVWRLARPAQIVREAHAITVTDLRLLSGDQSIIANGTFGRAREALEVSLRNVSLGSFQPFTGAAITELAGTLEADIVLRGTADAPQPAGELRLRDGRIGAKALGVTVRAIDLTAMLDPTRIRVDLGAQADEGSLRAQGEIRLVDYQPDNLDVQVDLDHWPLAHTNRYQAKIDASVGAHGSLSGPDVEGEITVVEASLRPDISLPGSGGPPPRDQTIEVVGEDNALKRDDAGESVETADAETDVLKQTRLDLRVVIERDAWVKKDNSALELTGDVRIEKQRGTKDIALIGDVRVQRGWIYLYGRRFDPMQGVVTFTGGHEIDPTLDIVLESRVGKYRVRTIVTGTASQPQLSFESEPALEDADILALLMFGRPVNQLGEGEKASLDQQAASFAAGYAASKLGQQLGDVLGVQISEIDVVGERFGVGRYLTPRTYLTVIQSLSGGREVDLDYYLTRSWAARASTDSEGENGIDLFWHKKY